MSSRVATIALAAVLVAVFACELAVGAAGSETALIPLGALRTREWSTSDWWRVVTFSFLHLNAIHLTLNITGLLWFGGIVEQRVGATPMLGIAVGAGVASGVVGMLLGPLLPTTGIVVGASGIVLGLLAAALTLVLRPETAQGGRDAGLRTLLVLCLVVAVAISFLPGVSLAGHVGGLFGGAVMAVIAQRSRRRRLSTGQTPQRESRGGRTG